MYIRKLQILICIACYLLPFSVACAQAVRTDSVIMSRVSKGKTMQLKWRFTKEKLIGYAYEVCDNKLREDMEQQKYDEEKNWSFFHSDKTKEVVQNMFLHTLKGIGRKRLKRIVTDGNLQNMGFLIKVSSSGGIYGLTVLTNDAYGKYISHRRMFGLLVGIMDRCRFEAIPVKFARQAFFILKSEMVQDFIVDQDKPIILSRF